MNSFLKWPGGKRWFIRRYYHVIPKVYNNYIEPFLGGGAVFFHTEPRYSLLSDVNKDLIDLYIVMRDYPLELAKRMVEHNNRHSKDHYYKMRSLETNSMLERAARFLYLNRTCYNGMYRVNRNGKFNVPIGTKTICDQDVYNFTKYSELLKQAEFNICDFEDSISRANEGDFIFADPPYVASSKQDSFINYNDKLFSWIDQKRLLESLCDANSRGAQIVAMNTYNSQINNMYMEKGFYTHIVSRSCVMAAKASKRDIIDELLITSFKLL